MEDIRQNKQLSEVKKNLTKQEIQERQLMEEILKANNSKDKLASPPSWLDRMAKAEWKRILNEINENHLISNLDYSNLALLCDVYSRYRVLQKKLKSCEPKEYRPLFMMSSKCLNDMKMYYQLLNLHPQGRYNEAKKQLEGNENEIDEEFGI